MMFRRSVVRALSIASALGLAGLGIASTAQAATTELNAQDRAFLQGAHQSNLGEIATGKLAQQKASSSQVRDLGAMLVADHTLLDAALRKVATAAKVSLPSAPNPEQRALQAKLTAASGDDFDAVFVSGQLAGHAKAMALGKRELAAGSDAAVKKAAAASAPVIAKHHREFMAQAESMGLPTKVNAGRTGEIGEASGSTSQPALAGAGLLLILGGGVLLLRRRRPVAA